MTSISLKFFILFEIRKERNSKLLFINHGIQLQTFTSGELDYAELENWKNNSPFITPQFYKNHPYLIFPIKKDYSCCCCLSLIALIIPSALKKLLLSDFFQLSAGERSCWGLTVDTFFFRILPTTHDGLFLGK